VQSTCGGSTGRAGSTQVKTAGAVHRGGGMASKQMGEAGAMQAAHNWGQQSRGRTGIFQGVAVVAAGNPAVAHRLSFCLESYRPHIAQHSTASPCTVTLSPWCRRGWLAAGHPGAQPCSTQRPKVSGAWWCLAYSVHHNVFVSATVCITMPWCQQPIGIARQGTVSIEWIDERQWLHKFLLTKTWGQLPAPNH
jgi:hypothetical protein